jgi:sn-glycerol 3-phosphate transport system ATP-binding protein
MGSIHLENVTKTFGKETVLPDLNLEIRDGSFTILVGPSGCGKSTTLRLITGLETPTSGTIYIDGQNVNDIAPGKRSIAMVFQNYALYPTMTVEENIEFGLENRKVPRDERKKSVREICEIVGLTDYLKRKPATLSGGQRQRVALARAMVKKPKVFLMDEPLSNLDAKLRAQMRVELIEMHKRLGTTFVYVTHDQIEAMSMGDDIVLMDRGMIVQQSSPRELYHNPVSIYAAQFIGAPPTNILGSVLTDGRKVGFRPEKVQLAHLSEAEGAAFQATVSTREILGAEIIYSLETAYGKIMAKSETEVDDGASVWVSVRYENLYLFGPDSMRVEMSGELRREIGRAISQA